MPRSGFGCGLQGYYAALVPGARASSRIRGRDINTPTPTYRANITIAEVTMPVAPSAIAVVRASATPAETQDRPISRWRLQIAPRQIRRAGMQSAVSAGVGGLGCRGRKRWPPAPMLRAATPRPTGDLRRQQQRAGRAPASRSHHRRGPTRPRCCQDARSMSSRDLVYPAPPTAGAVAHVLQVPRSLRPGSWTAGR